MNITKLRREVKSSSYFLLNSIRFVREEDLPGSQRRSPSKTLTEFGEGISQETKMSQVHWTLRWKTELTTREKCFILETLVLRMVISGRTFGDYLFLADLVFLVRESSRDFTQQRVATSAEIILDENSSWEERVCLVKYLYKVNGSDYRRIYGNLRKRWSPENHLSLEEVPLETYIDESPRGIPYSSYCKGYGEGSSRGLKKTPFSAELDGEEEVPELDSRILVLVTSILNYLVSLRRKRLGSKQ